jgi:hypothetical protein
MGILDSMILSMINFKDNLAYAPIESVSNNPQKDHVMKRLEGILDSVTVGDIQIEPWEICGLNDEPLSSDIFAGEEIHNTKERAHITEQAIAATREILKIYFGRDKDPERDLGGLCGVGSAIMQELLARANIRTILAFGRYHAEKTERHLGRLDYSFMPPELDFEIEGDYGHYWLYESLTGVIPASTEHALDDIIIADPTRCQFHREKPVIVHPNEGKYELLHISKSSKDTFYQENKWLWNDEELKQWAEVLNSIAQINNNFFFNKYLKHQSKPRHRFIKIPKRFK